ncbi:putative leucine-rich repeat-containing protein DDB_G0290503 [Mytilus edulis]|uniref:putative leucine-rich repeat-containing protein DDB_G0290503 n=1 Tax=Mytilus edulis TaxID=6550 RepID=UPI0039EEF874
MSDVSNEDDSADNDRDETWTPPSVISENETKQLEATNNELVKKLQNLEATYAEEGQAKYEAERRTEIAEKKLEALQDRLKRETEDNEKLSDKLRQHSEDSNKRIKTLQTKLEETESNHQQLIDKHHLETKEKCLLSKKVIEQEREYDAIIKKLVLELNETKTELLNVPDKYQELQRELSKDLCEQRSEYDIELRKVKTEAVEANNQVKTVTDFYRREKEENRQLQKVISIMTEELEIGKKKLSEKEVEIDKYLNDFHSIFEGQKRESEYTTDQDDLHETTHLMSSEVNKDILQYVGEKVISNSVLQKYPDVKLKRKSDRLILICSSQEMVNDVQQFLNDMITFAGDTLSWSLGHTHNETQSDSNSSDESNQTMVSFEMSSDDYDKLKFFCKDDIFQHASYDGTNLKLKLKSPAERQKNEDIIISHLQQLLWLEHVTVHYVEPLQQDVTKGVIAEEFPTIYCQINNNVIQLYGDELSILTRAKQRLEMILNINQQILEERKDKDIPDSDNIDVFKSKEIDYISTNHFASRSFSMNDVRYDDEIPANCVFTTAEGINVKVYFGSILNLEVECIVKATNENMSFRYGNSAPVYEAARKQYKYECENNSRRYGTLKVGTCVSSSSTNLYYKYVIHTAEPRWQDYRENEKHKCALDLKQSIMCCLVEADKLRMKSIALPFVSTGISPIPKDMCAKEYCKAIEEYSRIRNNTSSLLEIYFVDKNYALISLIRQEFAKAFIKSGKRYVSKQEPGRQNLKPFSKSTNVRAAQLRVRTRMDSRNSEVCSICWNTMMQPKKLQCGHLFCSACIDHHFKNEPTCPQCGGIQGSQTGIQPQGRMETNIKSSSLCGFPDTDTIEIVYVIPSGIQGEEHPHPGRLFEGITRRAYLPNNTKGQLVVKLLKKAFDRRLVFTIGTSRTTGKTGVIWNDISHKTNPEPNAAFGFPDDTYFDRVLDDLCFKGVTEKDIEP